MKKILSILIAMLLITVECFAPVLNVSAHNADEKSIAIVDTSSVCLSDEFESANTNIIKNEVLSLRDANSKHYMLEDGSFIAIGFADEIHRKINDSWVDIDNRFVKTGDDRYTTADGAIYFMDSLSPESVDDFIQLYGYSAGKHSVNFSISKKLVTHCTSPDIVNCKNENKMQYPTSLDNLIFSFTDKLSETKVIYYDITDGVDLEYTISGNSIKENIVLNQDVGNKEFLFDLVVEGLEAKSADDGSIVLYDFESGDKAFIIPAPSVRDAAGNTECETYYKLEKYKDFNYGISIVIDSEWIASKDRVFPVAIDPTVTSTSASFDTYIDSNLPTSNFGLAATAKTYDTCTTFMKINPPSIPDDATVNYVNLYTRYSMSGNNGACVVRAYECNFSWGETSLTYNIANGYSNNGISTAYLSSVTASSLSGMLNFDILSLAKRWYAGENNNGVAIKQYSGPGKISLHTYEAGQTNRPFIVTSYSITTLPLKNGMYYIRNASSMRGLQPDESTAPNYSTVNAGIQTMTYSTDTKQQWRITYLHNGYYKIVNVKSGLCLSISNVTSNTYGNVLKQNQYIGKDYQQWQIKKQGSKYVIRAKLGLTYSSDWCLSGVSGSDSVWQVMYTNDNNYLDEWGIYPVEHSILLAINDVDGAPRSLYFSGTRINLEEEINGLKYIVSTATYSSCSVNSMISYLKNNELFFVHTHGMQTGFKISNTGTQYIGINDLNGQDLSSLKLAILLTCETGKNFNQIHISNNTPVNIVEKMVICGAETVVGFNDNTYVCDCNMFAIDLTNKLVYEGLSVEEAINSIDYRDYSSNMKNLAVIGGNKANRIR